MKSIFTFPNLLSSLRAPLAFFLLSDQIAIRFTAIVLAMATDYFDGYLARKHKQTSQFGAFLDPLMDKFFVLFALFIFMWEGQLKIWEVLALMSRDFAVLLFGLTLGLNGTWSTLRFRSIWSGKIMTTIQFLILLGLTCHLQIPIYLFWLCIVLGVCAFLELRYSADKVKKALF